MKSKFYFVLTMTAFGTIGLFVRLIPMDSIGIAFFRGIIGSIFLILSMVLSKKTINLNSIKSNLKMLILSGICIGFNWVLLFNSYRYTSISIATVCYYFSPVFVMIFSHLILKEYLSKTNIFYIFTAFLGMFFVIGLDSFKGLSSSNLKGILYSLGAACLYATVIIINKFIKDSKPIESTVIQLSSAAMVLVPFALFSHSLTLSSLDNMQIVYLIIIGVIHTGLCYLVYFTVISDMPGRSIAILSYIDPISAILLSALILKESMILSQWIGILLILGSAFLSELSSNRNNKKVIIESNLN